MFVQVKFPFSQASMADPAEEGKGEYCDVNMWTDWKCAVVLRRKIANTHIDDFQFSLSQEKGEIKFNLNPFSCLKSAVIFSLKKKIRPFLFLVDL